VERIRRTFELVDIVRIDHFRGFAGYWEIPASEPTAIKGRWVPGPGEPLFKAISKALGPLPIIAEDLGVITPDVDALRKKFGFPACASCSSPLPATPPTASCRTTTSPTPWSTPARTTTTPPPAGGPRPPNMSATMPAPTWPPTATTCPGR
jgi:hypothetical protein